MQFKLKSKHLFYLIVGVAVGYIILGLVQALTSFKLDPELGKNLDTGFFVGAAALFIYMQQLRKKENAEQDAKREAEKAAAAPAETAADQAPEATGEQETEAPADAPRADSGEAASAPDEASSPAS